MTPPEDGNARGGNAGSGRQINELDATSIARAAVSYGARGWPVHPLHHLVNGLCSCGDPECGTSTAKHPRLNGWPNLQITDSDEIRRLWRRYPHANVGIRLGDGLAVLDVDPRNGGDATLAAWERQHGPLPSTPAVLTGGNGNHYYFAIDGTMPSHPLGPGVEFKCAGTQVVAPPSFAHVDGRPYHWEAGAHPDVTPLAPLPNWIRRLVDEKERESDTTNLPGWAAEWLRTPLPPGSRRGPDGIPKIIGHFIAKNVDVETAIATVELWDARNPEPLGSGEIRKHVEGMYKRYPAPGEPAQFTLSNGRIDSSAYREGVPDESNLTFRTARQIATSTPDTTEWLVDGLLPCGGIVELDGKIKASGKTTFALAMCRSLIDGSDFLGFATKPTTIVYLTEQPDSSLRAALDRAGLTDRDELILLSWKDTRGTPWANVVRAAQTEARERGARLLVVDTFGQFSGLRGDSENSAGAGLEAMEPLQIAAHDGLAVWINRHDRKSGGDVGESGRGSSAISGVVDIVLSLHRREGNTPVTHRELSSLSRYEETPASLVIDYRNGSYIALGESSAVALSMTKDALLASAPHAEDEAMTATDLIAAADGVKRTVAYEALAELVANGEMLMKGTGKRGDAKRYWIRPELPVVADESIVTDDREQDGIRKRDASGTQSLYTDESILCSECGERLTEEERRRGEVACSLCTANPVAEDDRLPLCLACGEPLVSQSDHELRKHQWCLPDEERLAHLRRIGAHA